MNVSELIAGHGTAACAVFTKAVNFVEQSWQRLKTPRSCLRRIGILSLLMMVGFTGPNVLAQRRLNIAGDYVGALGPLHLRLHLKTGTEGALSGTLDRWIRTSAMPMSSDPEEVAIAQDAAGVYAKSGIKAAIAREIELRKQLAKRRYADPSEIAYLDAQLGDKEQTFAWLDKARAEKSGGLEPVKSFARWISGTATLAISTC